MRAGAATTLARVTGRQANYGTDRGSLATYVRRFFPSRLSAPLPPLCYLPQAGMLKTGHL
jgi:hypothetical protein